MSSILIIDDEDGIRAVLGDILRDEGYSVDAVEDGLLGLEALKKAPYQLVFLDIRLPGMGGIDVLKKMREEYPGIEVIMISGHASVDLAVSAIKLGAFDFIEKPLSLERVTTLAANALRMERLKKENAYLKRKLIPVDPMIGSSPAMKKVHEIIKQSASSDARILITGENGTGKELAARAIHEQSLRAEKDFVEVNCAAIPDTLIESELFGHEKGAFTGAVSSRKGKFELADGGTLFLDEVADMSLSAQAKVLRAIQEQIIVRVGGHESIPVDIRIIAATNKDLEKEVAEGRFREDLFFRLNVIPVRMPALRDRVEDIPELSAYFLETLDGNSDSPRTFSQEAREELLKQPWPGNIRQFRNFIQRLSIMSDEDLFSLETVKQLLDETLSSNEPVALPDWDEFDNMEFNEARELFLHILLENRLKKFDGNAARAAEDLGISPANLHGKIKKYVNMDK